MSSDHLLMLLVKRYGENYEQQIGDGKIRELYLNDNQISDLSPLQNLMGLEDLHLINNQISDLTPLQNLTGLVYLYIGNNQINDLSPLQNLTSLERLDLTNNQISDLSPLQNLKSLEELHLTNNQISNLRPLQNLTGIERLSLRNNPIRTGPKNLKELQLLQRVKRSYWEAWLKIRLSRFHRWVHEMKKWYLIEVLYGKPDAYFRLIGMPINRKLT